MRCLRVAPIGGFLRAVALVCGALVSAVAASGQGLFTVSQQNEKVLRYDESNGSFIETFIEPITVGFRSPNGIAISPSDGMLYTSSTGTGEIWRYTTVTGIADPPAIASGLFVPLGIAFDPSGADLFVVDQEDPELAEEGNDAVKKVVVSTGAVSTVATFDPLLSDLVAVQVNGSDLYLSDASTGEILSVPIAGGSSTVRVSGLSSPGPILFRSPTDMVIAESGADRVLEYLFSAGSWVFDRVVLPDTAGVDSPYGLALAPDGRLSVSGELSDNVVAVDLTTLAVSTLVAAGAGGLKSPKDVAWSGSTLLVASIASNSVIYYDSTGNPTGLRAQGITAPADSGMTFSAAGDTLLVASATNNDIVEYDAETGAEVRLFTDACPTFLGEPFDVAFGPDDNLYVCCPSTNEIRRIDVTTGGGAGFVIGGAGGLFNPRGLEFGPNGNLFVSSGSTGEVLEYNGTTGLFVGSFLTGGGPVDPWGIAFHGGFLYVASKFPSEVMKYNDTTGAFVSTFVTSGSGGLTGPTAVAFGPGGDLYVTSFDDDAIRRYNGSTGAFVSTFVPTGSGGLDGPIDLGFRPAASATVPALSFPGLGVCFGLLALMGLRELRRGGHPRAGWRRS